MYRVENFTRSVLITSQVSAYSGKLASNICYTNVAVNICPFTSWLSTILYLWRTLLQQEALDLFTRTSTRLGSTRETCWGRKKNYAMPAPGRMEASKKRRIKRLMSRARVESNEIFFRLTESEDLSGVSKIDQLFFTSIQPSATDQKFSRYESFIFWKVFKPQVFHSAKWDFQIFFLANPEVLVIFNVHMLISI